MFRGVNRRIVEIKTDQNEYFERAILIVRDAKATEGRGLLRKKAASCLEPYYIHDKPKSGLINVFLTAALCLICAAISALAMFLLVG